MKIINIYIKKKNKSTPINMYYHIPFPRGIVTLNSKRPHRRLGHCTPVCNSVLGLTAGTDLHNSTNVIHCRLH